jgi:hypothetical protein
MGAEVLKAAPIEAAAMGAAPVNAAGTNPDKTPAVPTESVGMQNARMPGLNSRAKGRRKGERPMVVYCEAHLERAGRRVPAADEKLRLCRACLRGRPIHSFEEFGYEGSERDAARRRGYYLRYRPKILARMRRAREAAGTCPWWRRPAIRQGGERSRLEAGGTTGGLGEGGREGEAVEQRAVGDEGKDVGGGGSGAERVG